MSHGSLSDGISHDQIFGFVIIFGVCVLYPLISAIFNKMRRR
jgi:hypothetical protein